ncbi:MAG: hypothetical protein HRF45_01905 [Fimbriimonadia bacterium]|jgi:type II secretory pathway pseudopilin PulG
MIRTRRGFTLTEVLFAGFLVTIAALAMAAALPLGHFARQKADLTNKAAGLANRQLEEVRSVGYPNLDPSTLQGLGIIDSITRGDHGYPFTNASSNRGDAVSTLLPNGQAWLDLYDIGLDLKSVVITVQWTEKGRTRTVRMATMIGNL